MPAVELGTFWKCKHNSQLCASWLTFLIFFFQLYFSLSPISVLTNVNENVKLFVKITVAELAISVHLIWCRTKLNRVVIFDGEPAGSLYAIHTQILFVRFDERDIYRNSLNLDLYFVQSSALRTVEPVFESRSPYACVCIPNHPIILIQFAMELESMKSSVHKFKFPSTTRQERSAKIDCLVCTKTTDGSLDVSDETWVSYSVFLLMFYDWNPQTSLQHGKRWAFVAFRIHAS